jgi:hypothetical protein
MERLQFRILFRQFLLRVVDVELLSADGDPTKLLGQLITVMLSLSFFVSIPVIFGGGRLREESARVLEHFFIATTMLVVGLFAVFSWDSTFPDRRDVLVLAPLPVRARTLFLAKLAATGAGLGIAVLSLNGFAGLLWPWFFGPFHGGLPAALRAFAAYWLTLLAATVFVFGATLMLQGAASRLPRQMFLRLSGLLQIAAFCVFVSVYVLEPSLESHAALTAGSNQRLLASLPSYWFLGLFEQLKGTMLPEFVPLVRRAWMALAVTCGGVVVTVLLSYRRAMRKTLEEPDILPGGYRLPLPLLLKPVEAAVMQFSVRTMLRSRQHRLILSMYLGVGFGIVLILLRPALRHSNEMPRAILSASVLMLCATAAAMRAVFSMPITLKANWLLRVAALDPAARYAKAVRRTFVLLAGVPVWVCAAVVMLWLWPWRIAGAHLVLLALLGSMLCDVCMLDFHKIPFTCSYQPGKAKMQFAFWGIVLLLPLTFVGAGYEWRYLESFRGQILIAALLVLPAVALRWWAVRGARGAEAMQFEETEESEIVSLALAPDSVGLQM